MARPISCSKGFKSFPSVGVGNILSNGFEVKRVNKRNPKLSSPRIPITLIEKSFGKLLLYRHTSTVHIDNMSIHNSNEPSWAPQTAEIL